MKVLVVLLMTVLASPVTFAISSTFVGTYHCTGHDPYLDRDYKGTLTVAQQNTVYKITMEYDTGEKYRATGGQYNEELLSVVFQDEADPHVVGLEQYHLLDDKTSMGGYWVYLGKDKLGKETCTKDTA
tara:strand:- start:589 stop:972 length:384 start_codon:yes stop_codon:yes gene_type:complete